MSHVFLETSRGHFRLVIGPAGHSLDTQPHEGDLQRRCFEMELKNFPDKHCKLHQWLQEEDKSQCVDQQRPLGDFTQVA